MVLAPSGSTCLARVRASELARSALAGDTANMTQLWCLMYSMIIDLILCSMSSGWFPTGTRVMPGRSTRVMVNTCGLTIFRRMGTFEMDFPLPAPRLVSASISSLIFAKFVKVSPGVRGWRLAIVEASAFRRACGEVGRPRSAYLVDEGTLRTRLPSRCGPILVKFFSCLKGDGESTRLSASARAKRKRKEKTRL